MVNGRLIRIEACRSVGVWLFPPLLALAWFYLRGDQFHLLTMLWVEASVAVRGMVYFAGPALAGVAAWMAGRERRRDVEELLATTPRPAWSRQLATWTGTVLWGMLAYALVALAVGVLTARQAVWGGPILWPVVVGLLALPAHAALGFALGRFVPSRFTAPLVAAVFYFARAFVGFGARGAAAAAPRAPTKPGPRPARSHPARAAMARAPAPAAGGGPGAGGTIPRGSPAR